jgi:hypothetical protein
MERVDYDVCCRKCGTKTILSTDFLGEGFLILPAEFVESRK